MAFGDYPPEYNPKVHGPFDPARHYGKPDTAFGDLKLAEVGKWIGRRNKGIRPLFSMTGRAYWRWLHKYIYPRNSGIAPFIQIAVGSSLFFYLLNYGKIQQHRNAKYHW